MRIQKAAAALRGIARKRSGAPAYKRMPARELRAAVMLAVRSAQGV